MAHFLWLYKMLAVGCGDLAIAESTAHMLRRRSFDDVKWCNKHRYTHTNTHAHFRRCVQIHAIFMKRY